MSTVEYVIGWILVLATLAVLLATPHMLIHASNKHEHGPDCFWCHPHLRRRRNRR